MHKSPEHRADRTGAARRPSTTRTAIVAAVVAGVVSSLGAAGFAAAGPAFDRSADARPAVRATAAVSATTSAARAAAPLATPGRSAHRPAAPRAAVGAIAGLPAVAPGRRAGRPSAPATPPRHRADRGRRTTPGHRGGPARQAPRPIAGLPGAGDVNDRAEQREFDACMIENGVGPTTDTSTAAGKRLENAAFIECQGLLPGPDGQPTTEEDRNHQREYDQCMNDRGFMVLNPDLTPAFAAASRACSAG